MVVPEEKAKRHAIKQALRQAQRERFRAGLPLSPDLLRALFDFLDVQLSEVECDNTLKYAAIFLSERRLEAATVLKWLEGNGGFCDCEVLANVEEHFRDAFVTQPSKSLRYPVLTGPHGASR